MGFLDWFSGYDLNKAADRQSFLGDIYAIKTEEARRAQAAREHAKREQEKERARLEEEQAKKPVEHQLWCSECTGDIEEDYDELYPDDVKDEFFVCGRCRADIG